MNLDINQISSLLDHYILVGVACYMFLPIIRGMLVYLMNLVIILLAKYPGSGEDK